MTEQEKIKIFEQAKSKGFYGSIWGSFDPENNPTENGFKYDIVYMEPMNDLDIVRYSKKHSPDCEYACIGLWSRHSSEGLLYAWYFDSYGKSWALTEEELNGE